MRILSLLSILLLSWQAWAQNPSLPTLDRPVIDQLGIFTADQSAQLTQIILQIKEQGGPEVGVFVASSLQEMPIEDFSMRLAQTWKLGSAKQDNGLVIVIAPQERKMRIEVGSGAEGDVTDAESSRWIRGILAPAFKAGDYAGGVAQVLIEVGTKYGVKFEGRPVARRARRSRGELSPMATIFMLILFFIILPLLNRSRSARAFGAGAVLGGLMGGRHRGGGGFGGGGGWGGGGGGFSGGGASGDW